jgi:PHP family Zn ribbon phosphoesterase
MTQEPRNDKTCSACGDKYGSQEPPKHPSLCPYCANTVDRTTDERLERDHFDWFGD